MRRIDVIGIGIGVFAGGGVLYWLLMTFGVDSIDAGIWTQAVLVMGLLIWLATYLSRVLTKTMTYDRQLQRYEDAVLQKRLDELSPDELAALQAEIEQEKQAAQKKDRE